MVFLRFLCPQVANVGDSRILIGRPNGKAVDLLLATKEHKPDDKEERAHTRVCQPNTTKHPLSLVNDIFII